MSKCLIIQPIHPAGLRALETAGITPVTPSSPDMAVVSREIGSCDAAITRNAGLSATAIDAAPLLRAIGVHGIGVDPVDVDHATARGIPVVNTPHANVRSVAEHAIALLFALARSLPRADSATRAGQFGFKYCNPGVELEGLTFGVLGLGAIGQATISLAMALGMSGLAYSPNTDANVYTRLGVLKADGLEDLLTRSDVVSLHVPLTPDTRSLIGIRELRTMRRTAFLINTSRGPVVDEAALINALQGGVIAGAGLDVYASETMDSAYPLLGLSNVVLTPHIAGSTDACLKRTALEVVSSIVSILDGQKPAGTVNPEVWTRDRLRSDPVVTR